MLPPTLEATDFYNEDTSGARFSGKGIAFIPKSRMDNRWPSAMIARFLPQRELRRA